MFLDAEMSNIAKQRAKLDQLEADAIKKAKRQIEADHYEVGARLQEAVRAFGGSFPPIPTAERFRKADIIERRSDSDEDLDLLPDAKSLITAAAVVGGRS